MASYIRNISGGAMSLPSPYRGVLPPGAEIIVSDSVATILANMGGLPANQIGLVFDIGVANSTSPVQGGSGSQAGSSMLALTNFASGGVIGTAAATVNLSGSISINQTTAGQTLSLPTPALSTVPLIVYVENVGSVTFLMHGVNVASGSVMPFMWDGSQWVPTSSVAQKGQSVKFSADVAASTVTPETTFYEATDFETISGFDMTMDASVTQSDTVYATILIQRRDGVGGTPFTVCSVTTKVTGGLNFIAFQPLNLGALTNNTMEPGNILTYQVLKASTGTQLPSHNLRIRRSN